MLDGVSHDECMLNGALGAEREALRGSSVAGRAVTLGHPAIERGALLECAQRSPERGLDALLLRHRERLRGIAVTDAARVLLDAAALGEPDRAVAVRAGQPRDVTGLRLVARPPVDFDEVVVAHEARTAERRRRCAVHETA